MEPLWIFLPMILFIGLVTTYQDIKFGKIRNKWITIALVYVLLGYGFLVLYQNFIGEPVRPDYLLEVAATILMSLAAGFIMWWIGIWTAGDAKLFTAYSALVPLTVYEFGHIRFFASMTILINTFVPFFIVYLAILLFRTTFKQKLFYLGQSLEPKKLGMLLLFLFAFSWPVSLLTRSFGLVLNFFVSITALFLVLAALERLLKARVAFIIIAVSLLRLVFDSSLSAVGPWLSLLYTFLGFVFLRFFILYMGYDLLTIDMDIGMLRPGMVAAEAVYRKGKKYEKERILHFSLFSYLYETAKQKDYLYLPAPEGLTQEDLDLLKNSRHGFEHLRVYKTLSFAPYMFAGVLLTILLHGDAFIAIAAIIYSWL